MKTIIIITLIYFVLGAILLLLYKKGSNSKWIKYFTYLAIVASMLTLCYYDLAFYACTTIVLIGIFEIISLLKHKISLFHFIFMLIMFGIMSFSILLLSFELNKEFFLKFYCIIFTFDGFSQLGGQLLGKHKLISKISPNKTIEGLFCGILTAIITGILLFDTNKLFAIGLALSISLFALTGDLIASWYKRKAGVKDYNNLLPGHGGIMDRFDSMLGASTGTLLYLYGLPYYING